jgi:ribosomal protein S16
MKMNLLNRYVAEVGKYLPQRNRADIEAEIRSTLEDMLDERTLGAQASEAQVSDLLKEYGDPRKVAASYGTKQYLIGPRLYPIFKRVLLIVLGILGVMLVLSLGFSLAKAGMSGPAMVDAWLGVMEQFTVGLLSSFGNVVLVFAIIERLVPAAVLVKKEKDWNPADLAKEPARDRLDYPDLIASMFFTTVVVVILNYYPQVVGISFSDQDKWTFIPMLSPAFFAYLPWINGLSLVSIVLNLWLLYRGTWEVPTHLVGLALRLSAILLALAMLFGPSITAVSNLPVLPTDLVLPARLPELFRGVSIITLLAVILSNGLRVIKVARQLLSQRTNQ